MGWGLPSARGASAALRAYWLFLHQVLSSVLSSFVVDAAGRSQWRGRHRQQPDAWAVTFGNEIWCIALPDRGGICASTPFLLAEEPRTEVIASTPTVVASHAIERGSF
jgi:hypothetical protein